VTVNEVVAAVSAALQGCPAVPEGRLGVAAGSRRCRFIEMMECA